MIHHRILLSDGTEISSGVGQGRNIRSCIVTRCCNSGDELIIGSVCSACCELILEAPSNTIRAEDTFELFRLEKDNVETKVGVFNVKGINYYGTKLWKVTAYDNVSKLDIDLTEWLTEWIKDRAWPQDPRVFMNEICAQCLVVFDDGSIYFDRCHNIDQFTPPGSVTGRNLVRWVAEMTGFYCIANPDGIICFDWYKDNTQVVLSNSGERYRLKDSFKRHGEILPVDGVRILYGSGNICQSPGNITLSNQYIVKDNPLLDAKGMLDMFDIADVLVQKLSRNRDIFECDGFGNLIACEVSTPASSAINVGDIIVVAEQDPGELNTYKNCMRVMTMITSGQKDTLKCYGSYRRQNK